MKKKITFLSILCLGFFVSFGQARSLLFGPAMDSLEFRGNPDSWQTHITTNDSHSQALVIFADRDNAFYYLVDTSFNVIDHYAFAKDSMAYNYYGNKYEVILQTSSGNSFYNYLLKKNSNEIFIETPDFANKIPVFDEFLRFGPKEKFLTAFENNHHIYFLTHPKNSNELWFYVDSSQTPKKVALILHDTLTDLNLEKSLRDIETIKDSKEPDLITAQSNVKLYIHPTGSLVLTLDDNFRYTALWRFDLADSSSEGKIIGKDNSYCDGPSYSNQSNSYVYQNYILQAVFCGKGLLMQWKDISTGSILTEFHAMRDSAISFASSGPINKGTNNSGPKGIFDKKKDPESTVTLLTSHQFFKAINKSSLSFVIVPQDEYLIIKTGEAHEVETEGPGIGEATFSGKLGGAAGRILGATRWAVSVSAYLTISNQVQNYLTTILKKQTLEFIPDTELQTKYDKIDAVEDRSKDFQAAGTAFDFNGKTYFLYWHKKIKKFMLEPVD
jgi:hypothetical protein